MKSPRKAIIVPLFAMIAYYYHSQGLFSTLHSGIMIELKFTQDLLQNYEFSSSREWIETNGIGGWASSSVCGINTRRYHGLLVAAVRPPTERMVLVSKMDETIRVGANSIELGCNNFPGAVHPRGYESLFCFERGMFPVFEYEAGGVRLRKTVVVRYGENTVVVLYEVMRAPRPITLELRPFIAGRNYHSLLHANDAISPYMHPRDGFWEVQPYAHVPTVQFGFSAGNAAPDVRFDWHPSWYYRFEYTHELERGFDGHEDLFCPGHFSAELASGDALGVILSTQSVHGRDAVQIIAEERARRQELFAQLPLADDTTESLALAADQFIVGSEASRRTIIAGYPWFTDWGRDTMISLPGLCLCTGRFDDARAILQSFRDAVSQGMIPNRFPDGAVEPEYNTVDASLWFFVAAYEYARRSGDEKFIKKEIFPALIEILGWHSRGTRFGIREDTDGLLMAGDSHTQLTWMDAKIGDYAVTPRFGKPVEISALWYNARMIAAYFCGRFGQAAMERELHERALRTQRSFIAHFWNSRAGYLADCLVEGLNESGHTVLQQDLSLRPNQVIALGLPYVLLADSQAESIIDTIERELLTPFGLRSLSPHNSAYRAHYRGDSWLRDTAYHQGTVWGWLLGPYLTALLRYRGVEGKAQAAELLSEIPRMLTLCGVGSVAEIYDGHAPHQARGCPFQAWSVAELLRGYMEVVGAQEVVVSRPNMHFSVTEQSPRN